MKLALRRCDLSSERLGEFIKKVFTDGDFKQSFVSDPDKTMEKFGLGKQAKGAILSIGVVAIAGATDVTRVLATINPTQIWYI